MTFSLREFKAALGFCEATGAVMHLHFDSGGKYALVSLLSVRLSAAGPLSCALASGIHLLEISFCRPSWIRFRNRSLNELNNNVRSQPLSAYASPDDDARAVAGPTQSQQPVQPVVGTPVPSSMPPPSSAMASSAVPRTPQQAGILHQTTGVLAAASFQEVAGSAPSLPQQASLTQGLEHLIDIAVNPQPLRPAGYGGGAERDRDRDYDSDESVPSSQP